MRNLISETRAVGAGARVSGAGFRVSVPETRVSLKPCTKPCTPLNLNENFDFVRHANSLRKQYPGERFVARNCFSAGEEVLCGPKNLMH